MPANLLGAETAELQIAQHPDRMIMLVPGLRGPRARHTANAAVREGRRLAPKLSGRMASRMYPLYGTGYFGIGWLDPVAWYQERGVRPHTMHSLAGRVIPMWLDDPAGLIRQQNPKAQTRVTMSGRVQVLIFRRAGRQGSPGAPGAPGRIGRREAGRPWTTPGRRGGSIARGNIGVKWRYPGLAPRGFLNRAITVAAQQGGIVPVRIYACDRNWRTRFSPNLQEQLL
jgi:hypothetical protein